MVQSSTRSWWLLALCGILEAMCSLMILVAPRSFDGSLALRRFVDSRSMLLQMGILALAAGMCAIAAGLWSARRDSSWLLMLNGLGCSAFGAMVALGASRPVGFRSLALLVALAAASLGVFEGMAARRGRAHLAEEWLAGAAAVVSFAFAGVFLAFAVRWIRLEPSPSAQTFNWLGSYFAFNSICMLGLAMRRFKPREPIHRMAKAF